MLRQSNPSVLLKNVSKDYPASDPTIMDVLRPQNRNVVRALSDVNFCANQGDYVGVIGRNG